MPAFPILEGEKAKDALRRQVCSPVRWIETIEYFCKQGIKRVIELGPGRVLSGLMKRFDKTIECYQIEDTKSLEKTFSAIS